MIRRALALLAVAGALAFMPHLRAQETAGSRTENARAAEERHEPAIGWQLANFAILAIILGYMIYKNGGKFFETRTQQIQEGLAQAAKAKREADQRVADMERRAAKLAGDIEQMRADARREMAAEGERLRQETERHVRAILEQATQDIEMMIKSARRELTMYAAEHALSLAEQHMKGRITGDVEKQLVNSFIADLRTRSGATNN